LSIPTSHMSSSTRRQQQERDNEYSSDKQQQHESTIRSIDMTKDNIRRSIEEVRRETPKYSQAVTDFQNETADASVEIADNFLESQKEVINSVQTAWAPMAERIGQVAHYWTTTGMTPFFSPREMIDIYARTMGVMAEAYVTCTRMATNMMFAGMEATRATTNYTRQNAKEASRITSNTARTFAQTAKETVQVQDGEGERGREGEEVGTNAGSRSGFSRSGERGEGSATGSFESKGGGSATTTTTRTTYTSEGTTGTSGTGSGSTTTGTTVGTGSLSDTVSGITEKNRKKV
jgi:hypothetical protein